METAVQEEQPPTQQSAARQRKGYSWIGCVGLPPDVLQELHELKTELGLKFRDDVVVAIVGEIGLLAPAIKAGLPQIRTKDEGGTSLNVLMPADLIDTIRKSSFMGQVPLDSRRVLAAVLLAVRPRFKELARAGFARRLGGA